MGGFRDLLSLLFHWWPSPGGTPAPETPPIVLQRYDYPGGEGVIP
jgi:hypothetical protein